MDRDTFIITVYCLVEEHYQHLTALRPIRHGGFAPQLSDVEVITMVICGEFFKLPRDTDLFAYFRVALSAFLPRPHESHPLRAASRQPLAAADGDPASPGTAELPCRGPGPSD